VNDIVDPHVAFLVANFGIVPFWCLLVLAPRWKWTRRIVLTAPLFLALAAVYALLLFTDVTGDERSHMMSLDGVMAIFDRPQVVVAAWIHYLVFDLFIGAWEVRDAERRGIRHLYVVPCLVGTLVFGPVGLAAYLVLRIASGRGASLEET
jgi:hypothetical protein